MSSRFAGNFDYVAKDPKFLEAQKAADAIGKMKEATEKLQGLLYLKTLTPKQKAVQVDIKRQLDEQTANLTPEQKAAIAKYGFLPTPKWKAFIDQLHSDRQAYEAKWIDEHTTWIQKAAQCAGRALVSITHAVGEGISTIGELASKIPLVGPAFHAVFALAAGPFNMTESVLKGERIDHVALDQLKSTVAAVQEVAPYATTVLSLMPGVGTGIAGALGTALAVAGGMPVDEALVNGFAEALPGGAYAKGLFKVTVAAVSGDNVIAATGSAAIDALGLPPQSKTALQSALNVAYKAAKGDNIPKAALAEAESNLPTPELKMAFNAAVAVGHGKNLQAVVVQSVVTMAPSQLAAIGDAGKQIVDKTPVLRDVYTTLDSVKQEGYRTGLGLLSKSGVNTQTITLVRNKLTKAQQDGFDLAAASHIGGVLAKSPAKEASNVTAGTYFTAVGMTGADTAKKTVMLKTLTKTPAMKQGVYMAAAQVQKERSLWYRIKVFFGF